MNKLEHYLQQVCRSMGGPRAMREHVRQELREHLLDAASRHQAEGLDQEKAIEKAMLEFGQPDAVRNELEATHGHRALGVVIDTALRWKEKTLKAKWLWASWTYLMVVGILVLELLFCFFCMIYLLPKIKKLRHDGYMPTGGDAHDIVEWMWQFAIGVATALDQYFWWALFGLAMIVGLLEWRVRSENKPFIRLSLLNTLALGLLMVVVVLAVSLTLPFILTTPGLASMTPDSMVKQLENIDRHISAAISAGKNKKDLEVAYQMTLAGRTLDRLTRQKAFATLLQLSDATTAHMMQQALDKTQSHIEKATLAIRDGEPELIGVLEKLQSVFEPLREAIKRAKRE